MGMKGRTGRGKGGYVCRKSIATLALSYDNRKTVVRYFVNRAPGRGASNGVVSCGVHTSRGR